MVAASSKISQRPFLSGFRKEEAKTTASKQTQNGLLSLKSVSSDLPTAETCITHLRLLATFSELRKAISWDDGAFGISGSSNSNASELRWTIFIARAVGRFEKWIRAIVPSHFQPSLRQNTAVNAGEVERIVRETESLKWTEEMMPPLDVLMILHSYMLNPHDFLQDCLRNGGVSLWKAGFPWDLASQSISPTTLLYEHSEATIRAFENQTHLAWSPSTSDSETSLCCPKCSNAVSVAWTELYGEDSSQMEKGNTLMSFSIPCPDCHDRISQQSLSMARLRTDLQALLNDDIVMPGTLLSVEGLIHTTQEPIHNVVAPATSLLNKVLREKTARRIIEQIGNAHPSQGGSDTSLSEIKGTTLALNDGSALEGIDNAQDLDSALPALRMAARRMMSVYDRNFSHFALDLVGAVIRQGVFVEKMHYFDWVHSPAVEHIASCAIERYCGFFNVMQQNPGKTAVPTFDVDLVWHTQQLTPTKYYKYSLENCNNVFIDHDDKIVDDVLNNSFEWTCEQFVKLTGSHYDKCLCWCCAILEQESRAPKLDSFAGKTSSRWKGMLKRLRKDYQPSPAEDRVIDIQSTKFENDYANECRKAKEAGSEPMSKRAYFESYVWHYPKFAPYPEEVGAK